MKFTAAAHPNIAFIKYWGNRDDFLRIPANGSISMNLSDLETRASVEFDASLPEDQLMINGERAGESARKRVFAFLDVIRELSGKKESACVATESNFPQGAGIASSAAVFAALALAGSRAAGMDLCEADLSRLARRGSGSASRSVPGGYAEWLAGTDDETSSAVTLLKAAEWDLKDIILILSSEHKKTTSSLGHQGAASSPFQDARVESTPERLVSCRNAILRKDFGALAEISELDCLMMHAVMMTQNPPLFYWSGATLDLIKKIKSLRAEGLACFATVDAGPNVHVICPAQNAAEVKETLSHEAGIKEMLISGAGEGVRIIQ